MSLRVGETFVYGRSPAKAQALMEAAGRAGVSPTVVRATDSGYIVPNVVADELERTAAPTWAPANAVF